LDDADLGRREAAGTTTGLSLYAVGAAALRHYRLLWLPFGLAILAAVLSLMLPRQYTAESVFLPGGGSPTVGQLGGLAAQFDLNLGATGDDSPDLLAAVLTSREVVRDAAMTRYSFQHEGGAVEGDLVELLEIEGRNEREVIRNAERALDDLVGTAVNARVGTVTLRTSSRWPELAEQLNRRMLTLLEEFELGRRHASAGAEREFLQVRVTEAQQELEAAERELQRFLEGNVSFNSPQLSFQESRLQRRVMLRQSVYQTLAQSYEQARMEEARNISPITVISRPEGSVERTGPPRALMVIVAFMLGLAIAGGLAATREYARVQRELRPDEYGDYVRLRQAVVGGFRVRRGRLRAGGDR
jgi:uncharacterized protein involved in exopolysaccharide biosynthesis